MEFDQNISKLQDDSGIIESSSLHDETLIKSFSENEILENFDSLVINLEHQPIFQNTDYADKNLQSNTTLNTIKPKKLNITDIYDSDIGSDSSFHSLKNQIVSHNESDESLKSQFSYKNNTSDNCKISVIKASDVGEVVNIPKIPKGNFFMHDNRDKLEEDLKAETKNERLKSKLDNRWTHDLYDEYEQTPKRNEEIVYAYGYNIRDKGYYSKNQEEGKEIMNNYKDNSNKYIGSKNMVNRKPKYEYKNKSANNAHHFNKENIMSLTDYPKLNRKQTYQKKNFANETNNKREQYELKPRERLLSQASELEYHNFDTNSSINGATLLKQTRNNYDMAYKAKTNSTSTNKTKNNVYQTINNSYVKKPSVVSNQIRNERWNKDNYSKNVRYSDNEPTKYHLKSPHKDKKNVDSHINENRAKQIPDHSFKNSQHQNLNRLDNRVNEDEHSHFRNNRLDSFIDQKRAPDLDKSSRKDKINNYNQKKSFVPNKQHLNHGQQLERFDKNLKTQNNFKNDNKLNHQPQQLKNETANSNVVKSVSLPQSLVTSATYDGASSSLNEIQTISQQHLINNFLHPNMLASMLHLPLPLTMYPPPLLPSIPSNNGTPPQLSHAHSLSVGNSQTSNLLAVAAANTLNLSKLLYQAAATLPPPPVYPSIQPISLVDTPLNLNDQGMQHDIIYHSSIAPTHYNQYSNVAPQLDSNDNYLNYLNSSNYKENKILHTKENDSLHQNFMKITATTLSNYMGYGKKDGITSNIMENENKLDTYYYHHDSPMLPQHHQEEEIAKFMNSPPMSHFNDMNFYLNSSHINESYSDDSCNISSNLNQSYMENVNLGHINNNVSSFYASPFNNPLSSSTERKNK